MNGKSILSFLHKNYDFVHILFTSAKQNNFFIKDEVLKDYCREFEVDFDKLKEYRIVKEQQANEYCLTNVYIEFLSHLFNDFSMPLHESVAKYGDVILTYYNKLIEEKEHNKVNDAIESLIREIDTFSETINNRTQQLLTETQELKSNVKQLGYVEKAKKASYWIENYIVPLNDLLDRTNPHSVYHNLTKISNYSSNQQYSYTRIEIKNQFARLYILSKNIINEVLINSAIISRDLLPLAEGIRSESYLLTGAITYLEDLRGVSMGIKKMEDLPKIELFEAKRLNHTVYSQSIEQDAKFLWERIQEDESFTLQPVENQAIETWFFDLETKNHYKKKLMKDLPISNFFEWCHKSLKEELEETQNSNINSEQFFAISSLLFLDEEFKREFKVELHAIFEPKHFEIKLEDLVLELPKINLMIL